MELNEYQKSAIATAIYPAELKVIYPALGLAGEAGETADKVKKVVRDCNRDFSASRETIALEVGDVLWYCANIANDLGYSLEEIAQMNLSKINSRRERNALQGSGDNR